MKRNVLTVILLSIGCAAWAQRGDYMEFEVVDDAAGQQQVMGVPPALTTHVDSMLNSYYARHYLYAETDCQLPNYDPETSRETIKERLQRMPAMIDMPYCDAVGKLIDRYTKRARKQVGIILGMANFYMPVIEEALEAYGLPLELKYLPVVESRLNPNAVSRTGAAGLWQFTLVTGRQYGLEINTLVDDRRDPVRASWAAARFLKDLYDIFGDWTLVIAAYNGGPERVRKAIQRAGSTDYWDLFPYLSQETRGYVPAFIAANYIMNYYCEHNICGMAANLPDKTDTVHVKQDVSLQQIAEVMQTDVELLRQLNPRYRRDIVNGSSDSQAELRLPAGLIARFIDSEDSIYRYAPAVLPVRRKEVSSR